MFEYQTSSGKDKYYTKNGGAISDMKKNYNITTVSSTNLNEAILKAMLLVESYRLNGYNKKQLVIDIIKELAPDEFHGLIEPTIEFFINLSKSDELKVLKKTTCSCFYKSICNRLCIR